MYHYTVTNGLTGEVMLNSKNRKDFNGYSKSGKAYMAGLAAKLDNKLSDFCIIDVVPDDKLLYKDIEDSTEDKW